MQVHLVLVKSFGGTCRIAQNSHCKLLDIIENCDIIYGKGRALLGSFKRNFGLICKLIAVVNLVVSAICQFVLVFPNDFWLGIVGLIGAVATSLILFAAGEILDRIETFHSNMIERSKKAELQNEEILSLLKKEK